MYLLFLLARDAQVDDHTNGVLRRASVGDSIQRHQSLCSNSVIRQHNEPSPTDENSEFHVVITHPVSKKLQNFILVILPTSIYLIRKQQTASLLISRNQFSATPFLSLCRSISMTSLQYEPTFIFSIRILLDFQACGVSPLTNILIHHVIS